MKTLLKNEPQPVSQDRVQPRPFVTPDVNIYETKDGYVLEAEMPGVNKAGLEITLEGHEVPITGWPADEAGPGEILVRERQDAEYRRVFALDPAIDTARISARMNQGVLFLTLPKFAAVQPRKIAVSE